MHWDDFISTGLSGAGPERCFISKLYLPCWSHLSAIRVASILFYLLHSQIWRMFYEFLLFANMWSILRGSEYIFKHSFTTLSHFTKWLMYAMAAPTGKDHKVVRGGKETRCWQPVQELCQSGLLESTQCGWQRADMHLTRMDEILRTHSKKPCG